MNVSETPNLLRSYEFTHGRLLKDALSLKRYYQRGALSLLKPSEAFYLPAVNPRARIKWGKEFIQGMFEFLGAHDDGLNMPVFHVTIADKAHITKGIPEPNWLKMVKRKLAKVLEGLSYVGMVEPGYYNALYDRKGKIIKDVISWHGHFLVWGVNRKELGRWRDRVRNRVTPLMRTARPIYIKLVPVNRLGRTLCYIVKSPRDEYSVGRRGQSVSGANAPRYKANRRPLRPGHRVALFHMLAKLYLDQLSMSGGHGTNVLRTIKYRALADYRRKNGREDRRP